MNGVNWTDDPGTFPIQEGLSRSVPTIDGGMPACNGWHDRQCGSDLPLPLRGQSSDPAAWVGEEKATSGNQAWSVTPPPSRVARTLGRWAFPSHERTSNTCARMTKKGVALDVTAYNSGRGGPSGAAQANRIRGLQRLQGDCLAAAGKMRAAGLPIRLCPQGAWLCVMLGLALGSARLPCACLTSAGRTQSAGCETTGGWGPGRPIRARSGRSGTGARAPAPRGS